MREAIVQENDLARDLLSRDLGAFAGLLFEIGIGRLLVNGKAPAVTALVREKADKAARARHSDVVAEQQSATEHTEIQHVLDHSYHHHPVARMACLLILFLAFFLTTVFFDRNLKAPLRQGKTRLHLARLLADDLILCGGHGSFWARAP